MFGDGWNVSAWLLESDASHGCAGFGRRPVRKLQRSYGRDSRHLGATGRPLWVCCRALSKTQRTAAAQPLGLNMLHSRSMAFALAPNAKYDPLFAATVPPLQEYATQLWDGRINPGCWFERPRLGLIVAVRNHRGMEFMGRWVRYVATLMSSLTCCRRPPRRVAAFG